MEAKDRQLLRRVESKLDRLLEILDGKEAKPEKLYSIAEVANLFAVSQEVIRAKLRQGEIGGLKGAKKWAIPASNLPKIQQAIWGNT